jgi:hypothetical protein
MLGFYLKIGHDLFLPCPFQFIILNILPGSLKASQKFRLNLKQNYLLTSSIFFISFYNISAFFPF